MTRKKVLQISLAVLIILNLLLIAACIAIDKPAEESVSEANFKVNSELPTELYLLVPFYLLLKPILGLATLNIIQVITLAIAAWPAYLWLRELEISQSLAILLTSVLLISPFQIFGVFYDFHENCLLPLAIFSYLYFHKKGYFAPRVITALCLLGIKEDAFIYLLAISLYFMVLAWRREDLRSLFTELGFAVVSVVYFLGATAWIRSFGLDIMVSRFANLIRYKNYGLKDLISNLYLRPDISLLSILAPAKHIYILITLMTSGLVLLWWQKPGWILIIPLVFINLLSNWKYQINLNFQYHFGTQALVLTLLYQAFAKLKKLKFEQLMMLVLAIASSVIIVGYKTYDNQFYLGHEAGIDRAQRAQIIEFIAEIDSSEGLACSSFYAPVAAMAGHEVYEFIYMDKTDLPEYLLLDTRGYSPKEPPEFIRAYEKQAELEGLAELWKRR